MHRHLYLSRNARQKAPFIFYKPMAQVGHGSRETSPLLPNGRVSHDEAESQTEQSSVGWKVVIAVAFAWLASFLAALGELFPC